VVCKADVKKITTIGNLALYPQCRLTAFNWVTLISNQPIKSMTALLDRLIQIMVVSIIAIC
jgi:hypothetical protein